MSLPPIPPAERARRLVALRPAIAHQARALATLLAGVADLYRDWPGERDVIAYVGAYAEQVRHDLATLLVAERKLTEAA